MSVMVSVHKNNQKPVDIKRAANLMWIFYAAVCNFTFLIFVPNFAVFAFDVLLALGPLIFNLVWIYLPDRYKMYVLPDGWP